MTDLLESLPSGLNTRTEGFDISKHDSAVGTIVGVNAAFATIIATVIVVRLYVRLKIVHKTGADDILILFAGLFTILLSAACLVGTRFGLGRHVWDLNPVTVAASYTKIIKILYGIAATFTKASILAQYYRIFPKPLFSVFRRLMYITAAVILAIWICSIFVTIFQCDPIHGAWDLFLQNRKCLDIQKFYYISSSVNLMTDLLLCISPLPLLWKLRVSLNERVMVCLLFGFGLFASAASGIRLSQLHNLRSVDVSHGCVSSLNWSVVEVGTGVICASVPALKPLIKYLSLGKFFSLGKERRSQATSPNPSFTSAAERFGYLLEMDSHPQRSTVSLGSLARSPPQAERSIVEASGGMHRCSKGQSNIKGLQVEPSPQHLQP